MKIPIKFRGRGLDGKMRFGHYVTLDDYPFIKQDGCYYEVYPDSVAQLVGYDSAGNEVYEGDLLETHGGELVADMSLCAAISLHKLKEVQT